MEKLRIILVTAALLAINPLTWSQSSDNDNINFDYNSKYTWTELSREITSAFDSEYCDFNVDIEYSGTKLFLIINNIPYSPDRTLLSCKEWHYNGEEAINWNYETYIVYYEPVITQNLQMKFKIEGIAPGKKKFHFNANSKFISTEVDLYEGCSYHIEMSKDDEGYIKKRRVPFYNMEWIVYNPCDNQGNERFFQLRYGKKKAEQYSYAWDDMTFKGKHAIMYPVLMCDTQRFDEAKADTIAMMSAVYDLNEVTAVRAYDVDIPSEFWATGLPEATYNPSKWPTFNGTKDVKHVYDINKEYGGFNFYNFDGDRFA
ncbi:MAG: hypothetical protein J6C81_09100, partial [Muribaculaceae bacterium]|nr:hypothetical protein [Muribaculaceae bacterium]